MRVFELADRHRGSYSDDALGSVVCPFYCSYSGYQDELLWAAAWLHRASSNASFMPYVRANGMQLGAGDDDFSFSWDDKRIGTKVLLAKGFLCRRLPGLQLYKAHSDSYICTLVLGTSSFQASQYTPGGLIWLRGPLACQRRQIQRPHGPPHSPGTSGAAPPSSVPSSMAAHGWEEQAGKPAKVDKERAFRSFPLSSSIHLTVTATRTLGSVK